MKKNIQDFSLTFLAVVLIFIFVPFGIVIAGGIDVLDLPPEFRDIQITYTDAEPEEEEIELLESQLEGERIISIQSTLEIDSDASMIVTERWDFVAENEKIISGLVFYIQINLLNSRTTGRSDFELMFASINNNPNTELVAKYKRIANGIELNINEPEKILDKGLNTIIFQYRITNVVSSEKNHDELSWNIVGTSIQFPVEKIIVKIRLPGKNYGKEFKDVAWSNSTGENKNTSIAVLNKDFSIETEGIIEPFKGFSIAVKWDKGLVNFSSWLSGIADSLKYLLVPLLLTIFYFIIWLFVGMNKILPVRYIICPPDKISPGFARNIIRKKIDGICFIADIIDIANKGYFELKEQSIMRISKKIDDRLLTESQILLLSEFEVNEIIDMTENVGSNHRTIINSAYKIMAKYFSKKSKEFFAPNTKYFIYGSATLLLYALFLWIDNLNLSAFVFTYFGFLVINIIFPYLGKNITNSTITKFLPHIKLTVFFSMTVFLLNLIGIYYSVIYQSAEYYIVYFSLLICFVIGYIFRVLLSNYTNKGMFLLQKINGFVINMTIDKKDDIETIEEEQEKITDNLELYEKYLSWAVAFDIVEIWENRFFNIIEEAKYVENSISTISTPNNIVQSITSLLK